MSAELRNRLIFGVIFAAAVFGALLWDLNGASRYGLFALLSFGMLSAGYELRVLAKAKGVDMPLVPLWVTSLALLAYQLLLQLPWLSAGTQLFLTEQPIEYIILALGFIWSCMSQMFRYGYEDFTRNVGFAAFGLLYLAACVNVIFSLSLIGGIESYQGPQYVLMLIFTCKMGDVAAYFGGRLLGKHKLAPKVSPGKTWEGFFCSFIGAIGATFLVQALLNGFGYADLWSAWWAYVLWGLALGPVGVFGDLVESCIKRDVGQKDSSSIVPGFGGFLDIFDAVIIAAPVAYILALLLPAVVN